MRRVDFRGERHYVTDAMAKKRTPLQINIQKKTGIALKKALLLEAALSHPSYRNERAYRELENFDRLEFFGDSVINYVVCLKLLALFPKADEGELSKLRSILVSRQVLFRPAKNTGLAPLIQLGRSLIHQPEREKVKIYADAFEAFIAALFFDQGLKKTQAYLLKVFKPYFDPKKLYRLDPNPKSSLQELTLRQWKRLPDYRLEPHGKGFKSTVSAGGKWKASALGRSRQECEEKAASLLVRKIRQGVLALSKRVSSRKKLRKAP